MYSAFNICRRTVSRVIVPVCADVTHSRSVKKIALKVCRYSKNVYLCEKMRVVSKRHQ